MVNACSYGKSNLIQREEIEHREKLLNELSERLRMEQTGLHTPGRKSLLTLEEEEQEQLMQYSLNACIGNGLTGVVYKANHIHNGQVFAVKIIAKAQMTSSHMLNAVRGEVKLMNKCSHKNVVQAFEMFDLTDKLFIVLEL